MKSERGYAFIEIVISLALLGIISAAFLGATGTATGARSQADEQAAARNLAESQMEYIKLQEYDVSYDPAPIPTGFEGYSANITAAWRHNSSIQKVTVTIYHHGENVTSLECYKVNR
jgi:type II secretory pathway pseudopilin PulG